jgi:hypothetical protein
VRDEPSKVTARPVLATFAGQVFPTQEEPSKHLMNAHADDGLSDTLDEP